MVDYAGISTGIDVQMNIRNYLFEYTKVFASLEEIDSYLALLMEELFSDPSMRNWLNEQLSEKFAPSLKERWEEMVQRNFDSLGTEQSPWARRAWNTLMKYNYHWRDFGRKELPTLQGPNNRVYLCAMNPDIGVGYTPDGLRANVWLKPELYNCADYFFALNYGATRNNPGTTLPVWIPISTPVYPNYSKWQEKKLPDVFQNIIKLPRGFAPHAIPLPGREFLPDIEEMRGTLQTLVDDMINIETFFLFSSENMSKFM